MAAKTQVCKLTSDSKQYFFKGSTALYTAENKDITGVEPAAISEKDNPLYDQAELMRAGLLEAVAVRCRNGQNKFVTYRLLVEGGTVKAAIDALTAGGKTLNGNAVIAAGIARRRVMK